MADLNNKPAVGTAPAAQPTTVPQEAPNPDNRSASEGARQPQPRPCPQDCSKCSTPQHIFCSTKMLFDLSRAFQESRRQQAEIVQAVAEIQERLKPKEQEAQLSLPFDAGA